MHTAEDAYYYIIEIEFKAGTSYTIVRNTTEVSLCYMVLNF